MSSVPSEGWVLPQGRVQWHWFRDRRSVCGKLFIPHLLRLPTPDTPRSGGLCPRCLKKLEKEAA